jgi:uncharacterized protein (TIGR03000 family)
MLLLVAAVLFATSTCGWARPGRGGGHFGGGRASARGFGGYRGGFHHSGFRGGFYRGGYGYGYGGMYAYRGFYHRHYSYDYNAYSRGYNRDYGYGYYPDYGYGYYPYYDAYSSPYSGVTTDPGYGGYYPGEGSAYAGATYPSDYPPATGTDQLDRIARVTVSVPRDARLSVNGTMLSLTGSTRVFDSPPLPRGIFQYVYVIKAFWNEGGRKVTQRQTVEVGPGTRVNVRFPAPSE